MTFKRCAQFVHLVCACLLSVLVIAQSFAAKPSCKRAYAMYEVYSKRLQTRMSDAHAVANTTERRKRVDALKVEKNI